MNNDNEMGWIREMEPRRAFIGLCIAMAGCDEKLEFREIAKLREVMDRNGFTQAEVVKELEDFSLMNIEEAFIYGRRCIAAVPALTEKMMEKLLESLFEIAIADDYLHEMETKVMNLVKARMGD